MENETKIDFFKDKDSAIKPKYVQGLILDSTVTASFVYLIFNNVSWLSNLVYFYVWIAMSIVGIALLVYAFADDNAAIEKALKTKYATWYTYFSRVTAVIKIASMVIVGSFVTATVYSVIWLIYWTVRNSEETNNG